MRGLAVLMVVAFHVGFAKISGGFVGVDVFFVISGYLITQLLIDELVSTGDISYLAFLARRIRRLLPAVVVVLCVTLAVAAVALPPLPMIDAALAARAAAAYGSNIHFARLASDYFSGGVRLNPTLHTWSLGVEEQFYLVWPIFVLALARSNRVAEGVASRRLAWGLTSVGLLSLVASCWYTTANPSAAFYATPLRAWEFACGGLAAVIVLRKRQSENARLSQWLTVVTGWIGLALVAVAAVTYSPATEFPGVATLVPVIGASLLLAAGARDTSPTFATTAGLLSVAPIRWVGRRSYSWYLWHWPALVLGAALVGNASVADRIGFALLALVLADLTYRFVENPGAIAKRLNTVVGPGVADDRTRRRHDRIVHRGGAGGAAPGGIGVPFAAAAGHHRRRHRSRAGVPGRVHQLLRRGSRPRLSLRIAIGPHDDCLVRRFTRRSMAARTRGRGANTRVVGSRRGQDAVRDC